MPELQRIPSDKTVVKPATVEKIYTDKFIVGLSVVVQSDGTQPCTVVFQAYNFDTKELSDDPSTVEQFRIDNIWTEAARSPVFAQVLGGLVQVIFLKYQEDTLHKLISGMVEGADRDNAIAAFQLVQEQLQVPQSEIPPPFVEQVIWAKPQEQ